VIANETGASTLVLNPIEGLTDEELARGETYLSVMRANLVNLKIALGVN
jgi:zinc transport system substrate-binding protein